MAERGIHIVRAHLAKLPPSDTLTIAERRAQYERAEKVFPTPPEVKVERVTAPAAPAEWLRPPSAAPGRVVLYLHGGGYVIGSPRSHRHLAAAIATAAGSSALLLEYRCAPEAPSPRRWTTRWRPTAGFSTRVCLLGASRSRATRRGAGSPWRRCSPCAMPGWRCRGRRVHLAVGGSHVQRGQLCHQGRDRSHREAGGRRRDGARVSGRGGPAHSAGLAALRRPARPAAAADPGGAARRCCSTIRSSSRSGQGRRGWRRRSRCGSDDPRLALVPSPARRGGGGRRGRRPVRRSAHEGVATPSAPRDSARHKRPALAERES